MKRHYLPLLLLATTACVRNPYAATNRVYRAQAKALARQLRQPPPQPPTDSLPPTPYWVGTVNFNLRKPNYVIIHHTAQDSTAQTLKTFTLVKPQVSAHYVIGRDGRTYHLLSDYLRAWHAGVARWGGITDVNSVSVGIELDNNGTEPFTEPQLASLLRVLAFLKKSYGIPAANFIGHGDIAPVRKNDPSRLFPWQRLAQRGYGLWYDGSVRTDTTAAPFAPADSLGRIVGLAPAEALRVIGYDTRNLPAAIEAFKRHFAPEEPASPELTELDRRILGNLYRKYL